MSTYALRLDDLDQLSDARSGILEAAKAHSVSEPAIFEEYRFVAGTGYGERVIDEVELVLSNKPRNSRDILLHVKRVIDDAGLSHYAQTRVVHLSVGWQKYLSLVLFVLANTDAASAVAFLPFHYLDDDLAYRALEWLSTFDHVIVVDLDIPRLKRLAPYVQELVMNKNRLVAPSSELSPGPNANW